MKLSLKNIIIFVIILLLAVASVFTQDILLSLQGSSPQLDTTSADNVDTTSSAANKNKRSKHSTKSSSGNSAADGLSDFYEKVYGSSKDGEVEIINNIVYLPEHKGDIEALLNARALVVRPFSKNWIGTNKSRAFRQGETIYEKLEEYALEDKLEIIWWVNLDFVIKDNFRVEGNLIDTAFKLTNSVTGHFQEGLYSYFCYRERTLVVTDNRLKYLRDNCRLLRSRKGT
jgi:hypothetical protein